MIFLVCFRLFYSNITGLNLVSFIITECKYYTPAASFDVILKVRHNDTVQI
jgi:hypothetical protein